MNSGRRVRVGARLGFQGVDVCLRPGRWCVECRQGLEGDLGFGLAQQ